MKLKVMRPLASALLAVFLVSLLPIPLVPAAQTQSPQPAQRRGKNGSSQRVSAATTGKAAQEKPRESNASSLPSKNLLQQTSDYSVGPSSDLEGTNLASSSGADRETSSQSSSPSSSATDSSQPSPASDDQTGSDQSSASTGSQTGSDQPNARPRRREPPPFDRPPLKSGQDTSGSRGSTSSGSDSGRSSRDHSQNTQRQPPLPQPDRGSSSRTRAGSDSDGSNPDYTGDSPADRTGRQRPVLRRDSEARNSQGPPVLRKPSDQDSADGSPRGPNSGGDDRGSGSGDDDVVRLESTLVNIPLLVSDRSGRYIPQLTKRDFLLWEDGTPQEIASFGSEQVPFKVALLLDVSPSVQGSIRDIQDAAIEFVRQLRSQDEVMVVSFDHNAHLLCDFTNNRMQLESAIRSASMGSGTSVYETVYEVVARRLRGVEGRKALILFSDGEDTTSRRVGYDDAINIVTESDVLVYGLRYPGTDGMVRSWPWPGRRNPYPQIPNIPNIPFPWPWPRRRGPIFHALPTPPASSDPTGSAAAPQSWPRRGGRGDFMADITAAGGGPVFDAQSVNDMRSLAARIAEELRHVYVISYYPTNPLSNGGYRAIRVKVRNRDDIAVRHRRGYNASSGSNVH